MVVGGGVPLRFRTNFTGSRVHLQSLLLLDLDAN